MKNIAYNNSDNPTNLVFKLTKTRVPKLCLSVYKSVPVYYVDYEEGWTVFIYKYPFDIYVQKVGKLYNVSIGGMLTKLWYKNQKDFYNNIIQDIENIKQVSVNLFSEFLVADSVLDIMICGGHVSKEQGISRAEYTKLIRKERAKNRK
jgi:hypothetical protein